MVCESGEPDDDLFVFEGGDAVADEFGSVRGKYSADRSAHGLEGGALRLRNGGEVLPDGGRGLPGAGGWGWFCFGVFSTCWHVRNRSGMGRGGPAGSGGEGEIFRKKT